MCVCVCVCIYIYIYIYIIYIFIYIYIYIYLYITIAALFFLFPICYTKGQRANLNSLLKNSLRNKVIYSEVFRSENKAQFMGKNIPVSDHIKCSAALT